MIRCPKCGSRMEITVNKDMPEGKKLSSKKDWAYVCGHCENVIIPS